MGEQFHTKLTLIEKQNGTAVVVLGSGQPDSKKHRKFQSGIRCQGRRNSSAAVICEIKQYYDRIWYNQGGHYTEDYPFYEDTSLYEDIFIPII